MREADFRQLIILNQEVWGINKHKVLEFEFTKLGNAKDNRKIALDYLLDGNWPKGRALSRILLAKPEAVDPSQPLIILFAFPAISFPLDCNLLTDAPIESVPVSLFLFDSTKGVVSFPIILLWLLGI